MDNLYWLDQISPDQLALVGYKALHLSHLLQKGHPVLPGFVVSANVLHAFLKTIAWSDPLFADLPHSSLRLDIGNPGQLRAIARQLRLDIESASLPDFLLEQLESAVLQLPAPTLILRPSLTVDLDGKPHPQVQPIVSSTGLVNIQLCRSDRDSLAQALKRLWADLYGAKSLFYWQRLNIPLEQVHLAVLVQPIESAIAAGTVHTAGTQFEIQATVGLGMAIAWGEVVPDRYRVDAVTGIVQTQQLGWKTMAYQVNGNSPENAAPYSGALSTPATLSAPGDLSAETTPCSNAALAMASNAETKAEINAVTRVEWEPVQLSSYFVDDAQRHQYVLQTTDLDHLVQMVRSVVADVGPRLDMEWVLHQSGEKNAMLFLNQVTPYSALETAEIGVHPARSSLLPVANPSETNQPAVNQLLDNPQKATATALPQENILDPGVLSHATLIAAGLAVSGGQAIARALLPHKNLTQEMLDAIPPYRVLVAPIIPLDWLPAMEQAAALVSEQGSMTSHSAIIARNLGVPAVFLADATRRIQDGELLWIDGDRGKIYRVSEKEGVAQPGIPQKPGSSHPRSSYPLSSHPSWSADIGKVDIGNPEEDKSSRLPLGTQLLLNLSQPNQIKQAATLPTNGVGLLRAEMLALSIFDNHHPLFWLQQGREGELVERLATSLEQFAQAFSPRLVVYRSFDFRPHEFQRLPDSDRDSLKTHPMLGLRGTFSYQVDPTLFSLELAALARVQRSGFTNLHLMLPFVRTVEEFQFCARLVQEAGLTRNPHFQLWIMAEVPSVLLLLPDYVQAGVQGISIGTNDLTQLLLGVDRDQAEMAIAFEDRHPAVKRAIAQLIRQSQELGIPCSICGEAPARYPDLVQDLVNWGIDAISVAPEAVEATYWAIAQAEQNLLLKTRRQEG